MIKRNQKKQQAKIPIKGNFFTLLTFLYQKKKQIIPNHLLSNISGSVI